MTRQGWETTCCSIIGVWLCLAPSISFAQDSAQLWNESRALAGKLRKPLPQLTDEERAEFLRVFDDLAARRAAIEAEERRLTQLVEGIQKELKAIAEARADYQERRGTFAARVKDYNQRCNRSFRDPAAVAQCDAEANNLQLERQRFDSESQRLTVAQSGLQARQAETLAAAGSLNERDATLGADLKDGFYAPVSLALKRPTRTATLRVTSKSFIKRADLSSMRAEERPRMEQAFGVGTNWNFSEDPGTPDPTTRDFRLWSQVTVVATCRGDVIADWKTSQIGHRGGKEFTFFSASTNVMDALSVKPSASGREARALRISYGIKGRPNEQVLWTFRTVRARTCADIWHRVEATVTCRNDGPVAETKILGSRFPSHRVWADKDARQTVEQGPLSALWDCDPGNAEMVR